MMPSPIGQDFGAKVTPRRGAMYLWRIEGRRKGDGRCAFGPISTPILYDSITPLLSRFLFVIEFEDGVGVGPRVAHLQVLQFPLAIHFGQAANFKFFKEFVVRAVGFSQDRLPGLRVDP